MKKTLSIILTALLLLSCTVFAASAADAWDGTAKTEFSGSGTVDDPYVIDSGAKLAKLAELVNAGESYEGKYFTQTDDIDLGGKEWTPIGSSTNPFKGVYNGMEHRISNLYISNIISQCGLFGYICSTADNQAGIANLTLDGKIVSDAMTVDAGLGALCGWCYKDATDGFKNTVIQNIICNVDITVTNCAKQPRLGGVVGYVFDSVLENVVYNGTIDYSCSAVSRVGGIAGQTNRTLFRNCVNNGTVKVTNSAGNATGAGIAAVATYKVDNVYTDFENCINNGKIEVTNTGDAHVYAAGILGQPYSSGSNYFYKFNGCVNNGDVTGTVSSSSKYAYVGGIFAYLNKAQASVENCVNTGVISSVGGSGERAGGIGGCFSGAATLEGIKFENNKSVCKAFGYVTSGIDVSTNTSDTSAADAKALADTAAAAIKGASTLINGFSTAAVVPVTPPVTPPATGDGVWFAVIALAVSMLGMAAVIGRKSRNNI